MAQKDSQRELRMKIEAEYTQVAASAKATVSGGASTSLSIGSREARTKLTVLGGDPRLWLQMTKDNQDDVQKEWAKSVNADNEYPTEFRLVPIWELLDHDDMDRKKAQELKSFMLNRWKQ